VGSNSSQKRGGREIRAKSKRLQIVDKTIMEADTDRDGKISFEEFTKMVENTDVSMSMTLGKPSILLGCRGESLLTTLADQI